MHSFTLSLSERRALAKQIHETKDIKILKRAQAFLWLSDGIPIQDIAKRLGITRQTIYVWVSLYHKKRKQSFLERLQDQPKLGRPPRKSMLILQELANLLRESPRQRGYRYAEWTASLLKQVLQCTHNLHVSTKTIRRCLRQLHYVWKRPGYALARQSPTWAQEKGGSKEDCSNIQDW